MGLDVYLYDAAEAEILAKWDAYDALSDSDETTQEELEAAKPSEACPYGSAVPSHQHPEHYFNRRYLRSSYNDGGFNNAVPEFTGTNHGLYWIFDPLERDWDGGSGHLSPADLPALAKCRERALQVVEELRACSPLRTLEKSSCTGPAEHLWHTLPTADEVLAWYREEAAKNAASPRPSYFGESYSNAKGLVFGFAKGLEVLAVTLGRDVLGRPAAVLVFRPSGEALESYVQSAEIVVEFIEEAIMLVEQGGSAYMRWSG